MRKRTSKGSRSSFKDAKLLTRGLQAMLLLTGPALVAYFVLFTGAPGTPDRHDSVRKLMSVFGPFTIVTYGLFLAWIDRMQKNVAASGGTLVYKGIGALFFRGWSRKSSFHHRLVDIWEQSGVPRAAANRGLRVSELLIYGGMAFAAFATIANVTFRDAVSAPYVLLAVAGVLTLSGMASLAKQVGDVDRRLAHKAASLEEGGTWARALSSPVARPVPAGVGHEVGVPVIDTRNDI